MNECRTCEGTGIMYISCCGDDIRGTVSETDLCPSCLEHCGDEGEDCLDCNGTGEEVDEDEPFVYESRHDKIMASNSHDSLYIFNNKKDPTKFFAITASQEYIETL